MDWGIIEDLRKYLHIVHHVPGRVRVKFDAALAGHPRAAEVIEKGKGLPGIHNVRLNIGARSIILEYDRERIQPELLEELFAGGSSERMREIVRRLSTA